MPADAIAFVDAAVAERRHHRPEAVGRRRHFHRVGVIQLDLPGRESTGAELVLEPSDPVAVGCAVTVLGRHQIKTEPSPAVRGALRPGEGEREPAIDVAGKPLEPAEHDSVVGTPRHGRSRADIAAALLLGDPGAAGRRLAVHTDECGQVGIPHRLRREAIEHVGDGACERHRAMDRDVGLCKQVAHGEGQRVGAPLGAVVEPDDAPLVDLAVNRRVERIVADHGAWSAAFVQGFQNGWGEAAAVLRLLVNSARDPCAEAAQPLVVLIRQPGRAAAQEDLKIPVAPVGITSKTAVPVHRGCATFSDAGKACGGYSLPCYPHLAWEGRPMPYL